MPASSRALIRGATKLSASFSRRPISSFNKTPPPANQGANSKTEQAQPLGAYYESIIINPQPIPDVKPEDPPQSSPKAPRSTAARKSSAARKNYASHAPAPANQAPYAEDDSGKDSVDTAAAPAPLPSAEPSTAEEKARIIFGSRLAGPFERAERLKAMKDRSTLIAGILVPPRPDEPDNCCMSGCVNCVWDTYRDEMEEWVSATARAEERLQAQRAQGPVDALVSATTAKVRDALKEPDAPVPSAERRSLSTSMDDDGGGSETNWPVDKSRDLERPKLAKDFWDDDLYKGVPVGIREFMRTEKKLKERHAKDGSVGG